ncbi:MAG TPA: hypothetical protein VFY84_13415 [Jiangellales bacterium]|nr:hypothetical protein [Jiangellales bacterium]
MHVEAARELKAELRRELSPLVADRIAAGEHAVVALGLSIRAGEYAVAVRHSGQPALADIVVERGVALAGSDCDIRDIGLVAALQWSPGDLQARVRPLRPGLSVAHAAVTAGTIGGFVVTDLDQRPQLLSNNHVLADSDRAEPGSLVVQPGPADGGTAPGDRIGVLDRVAPLLRDRPNVVDAATVLLDDQVDVDLAYPAGSLAGVADAELGRQVEKAGRTTGLTRGEVTAIELDSLTVRYPIGLVRFDDQIEVTGHGPGPFSAGGDSGSVVYDGDMNAVSLLFAGSERGGPAGQGLTYCNPIGVVLDELDVRFAGLDLDSLPGVEHARAAKEALAVRLRDDPRVGGVGLTRWHGRYAVRVNIVDESDVPDLPTRVHGIEVQIVAVGEIRADDLPDSG